MANFTRKYTSYIILGALLAGIYAASLYSYILFHSIAEIFSIVIAFGIFVVAWNARQFFRNSYLLFMGIAYLSIGALDLVHALAYKGMGIFTGYGSNLPTQLWIAARYVESLSLLVAVFLIGRKLKPSPVVIGFVVITGLLLTSIFYWKVFPVCYVDGIGLTEFKKVSEYVISGILLAGLILLYRKRGEFDKAVMQWISASIITTIAAELLFTSYVGVYDAANLMGHLLKIVAFFFIYKAIIETGIAKPYTIMLRDLKQTELNLEKQAAELEDTNQKLSAANKELEAFSYSVSHDLNAPLRSINGFTQIIAEDYAPILDDQGKRYIQIVRESTAKMERLINDLLALSRIGRMEINREPIDLGSLATSVSTELRQSQPERNVEFAISPGLEVSADPGLMKIALQNLLGNAWKYTGAHPSAKIEFGWTIVEGKDTFFVKDDGAGFDMEHSGRIFIPFQRLHPENVFPGSGIGLATVKRIIDRHGGAIWAEGQVEKGATFYFTLR